MVCCLASPHYTVFICVRPPCSSLVVSVQHHRSDFHEKLRTDPSTKAASCWFSFDCWCSGKFIKSTFIYHLSKKYDVLLVHWRVAIVMGKNDLSLSLTKYCFGLVSYSFMIFRLATVMGKMFTMISLTTFYMAKCSSSPVNPHYTTITFWLFEHSYEKWPTDLSKNSPRKPWWFSMAMRINQRAVQLSEVPTMRLQVTLSVGRRDQWWSSMTGWYLWDYAVINGYMMLYWCDGYISYIHVYQPMFINIWRSIGW